MLYGIDIESYNALRPFNFKAGGPFQEPFDIIIDEYLATSKNLKVGDKMEVLNHEFRICGIVEQGKGGRKFMPLSTVQELLGAQGKASIFYVKLDDPKNMDAAAQAIKKVPGMESYGVRSIQEYMSQMTPDRVPGLSTFIGIVIGVSVCIGFIVIFQSMYTAVMERTREIGILKSMGASKAYIIGLILRETVLLTLVGIVVGVAFSYAARAGIVAKFPTVRVIVELEWVIRATLIALGGAVLGALYPAYRAAQKDPIDALAYE
jgi:putative ABC transport system permease protein